MEQQGVDARAAARVGQVLRGKWRLDKLVGVGGYAAVYAATHRAGKRVAIKVLHAEMALSPEIGRRFLREAYVANAIEHPGIVSVLDDDVTDDGAPFLVMDLLDGDTLDGRRKANGGRLDLGEVLSVVDQALDVLSAAHDKGVIHRDIKPHNLFLLRSGGVRIIDFGIARLREASGDGTATQNGLAMGSPAYIPPEQARGRWDLVDVRTDLWALGATMFTLLSGHFVHGQLTPNEMLIHSATQAAPSILSLMPGLPPSVAHVVDKALAFDKDARWESARRMQEAVRIARGEVARLAEATMPLTSVPVVAAVAVAVQPAAESATTNNAWSRSGPGAADAPGTLERSPSLLPGDSTRVAAGALSNESAWGGQRPPSAPFLRPPVEARGVPGGAVRANRVPRSVLVAAGGFAVLAIGGTLALVAFLRPEPALQAERAASASASTPVAAAASATSSGEANPMSLPAGETGVVATASAGDSAPAPPPSSLKAAEVASAPIELPNRAVAPAAPARSAPVKTPAKSTAEPGKKPNWGF